MVAAYSADKLQVYRALQKASERIGSNNYRAGLYRVKRGRRGQVIQGYTVTPEHRAIVDAMPKVLAGTMTPDEAMSLLWGHDVEIQIYGAPL